MSKMFQLNVGKERLSVGNLALHIMNPLPNEESVERMAMHLRSVDIRQVSVGEGIRQHILRERNWFDQFQVGTALLSALTLINYPSWEEKNREDPKAKTKNTERPSSDNR